MRHERHQARDAFPVIEPGFLGAAARHRAGYGFERSPHPRDELRRFGIAAPSRHPRIDFRKHRANLLRLGRGHRGLARLERGAHCRFAVIHHRAEEPPQLPVRDEAAALALELVEARMDFLEPQARGKRERHEAYDRDEQELPPHRHAAHRGDGSAHAFGSASAASSTSAMSWLPMSRSTSTRMRSCSPTVASPRMYRVSSAAPNSGAGLIASAGSATTSETPSTTTPTTRLRILRVMTTVLTS